MDLWLEKLFQRYKDLRLNPPTAGINFSNEIQKEVTLFDKETFFMNVYDANLFCFTPSWFFMPTNPDYGSQASRIAERVEFIRDVGKHIDNPAALAGSLMNSKFEKIDYLYWNNNLFTYGAPTLGGPHQTYEFKNIDKAVLLPKYFEPLSPNFPIYRIKHEENFINKPLDDCTFFEKKFRGYVYKDSTELKKDLALLSPAEYAYFNRHRYVGTEYTLGGLYTANSKIENENWVCGDNATTPPGMLIWGPYINLENGSYKVVFTLKVENNQMADDILEIQLYSNKSGKIFNSKKIKGTDFIKSNQFQDFALELENPEGIPDLETRVGYMGKIKICFKKVMIIDKSLSSL